jgi:hypothetical protein
MVRAQHLGASVLEPASPQPPNRLGRPQQILCGAAPPADDVLRIRSEYVGQYTILIERKGDTYDYQWIQNDQVTDHGIGIASGDTLSVAFDMNGTPGLSVLTPDGPNRLKALWSVVGSETIGTETLTKIP